jgi:hypothetical protein
MDLRCGPDANPAKKALLSRSVFLFGGGHAPSLLKNWPTTVTSFGLWKFALRINRLSSPSLQATRPLLPIADEEYRLGGQIILQTAKRRYEQKGDNPKRSGGQ